MTTPHHWLRVFTLAGLAACTCRRGDDAAVSVVGRTPEYLRFMQSLTGHLDEPTLMGKVAEAWSDDEEFAIAADDEPAWRCVVRPVDAPATCVAVVSVPADYDDHHDAFYSMIENLPDIVTRHDSDMRYIYANPAFTAATGLAVAEVFGRTDRELGVPAELVDRFEDNLRSAFATGRTATFEYSLSGTAGRRHHQAQSVVEVGGPGRGDTVLTVVRDITELHRLHTQLELLAGTDALTSLPNRRSFFEHAGAAFAAMRSHHTALCLLWLDVDNMKAVNDRFGHLVGDRVLQEVGRILAEETGSDGIAARMGGDEFCVLLRGSAVTGDATLGRIRRRIAAISLGVDDIGAQPPVEISVGMAQATSGDAGIGELMARVDPLLYEAKARRTRRRRFET